ncbi:MAG TPA: threonine/serine dehydratase [Steroidobacteraceae bacterium]|nr:threonine/serine dehydratase [Steroidobacteraceae bacterium]
MAPLFAQIEAADVGIRPQVLETPLEFSPGLAAAAGCHVLLKCEHLQPTGSFKVRGAANKIRVLSPEARRAGVLTASTGNHGQGVARAGALAGVAVTVYVGAGAAPRKIAAIRSFGAEVIALDGPPIEAELEARRQAQLQGKTYISPYNDLDVIAGQGTIGCELARQAPQLSAVFVAVGGGGLISGIGTALEQLSPRTRIVGVWPENSPCMLAALEAGAIIDTREYPTLSDATAGAVEAGAVTFPICREVIDDTVTVTEAEIAAAMRTLAETDRWIVEGAAGVAVAGLLKSAAAYRGEKVAAILCGRNIALDKFLHAIHPLH